MYEFLLVGGVVLWLAMAFLYARSGVATIYHPATFYMFFQGFIFVIRPIMAWVYDYQFVYRVYSFVPPMEAKIAALLCADLGFLCFMLMVLRSGREPLVLRPTVGSADDSQRRYRTPLMITAALLAPLGIYSLRYVLGTDTGEVAGMEMTSDGMTISTTGNGYLFTAGDIVGVLAILIAWQFRFRPLALVPFVMFVVARAAGGTRWTFVLTSAALALFWLYDRRRKWPSMPVVAGAVAMLAVFALVGEQRNLIKASLTGGEVRENLFQQTSPLEGMDYANMEYLEYQTWVIPNKTGTWGYFAESLQVLTEPIPRVLWPGKPIGAPIKMWDFWLYGTPIGMTSSMPGVGWAGFGYVGVALWCGLWGWLLGRFYNWFARSRQTAFGVALYLLLMPLTVQLYRDGGLMTALKFPMWFVFTILVWKLMARLFPPAGVARAPTMPPQRPLLARERGRAPAGTSHRT